MIEVSIYLFYILVFLCCYSYFIYPLILMLIPEKRQSAIKPYDKHSCPSITLIVTVHNEEARIQTKLDNINSLNYPEDLLEIIVASDYSTDSTESIVAAASRWGVRLIKSKERKGKEHAQLLAIKEARGDILVFSDVATEMARDSLHVVAGEFSDPNVGAVSSEDQFITNDGKTVGEGLYVKYEMWLRRLESRRAGLVGLSGSLFAARKEVCAAWDIYSPSDFNTAINAAKLGLVSISSPDVVGIYKDIKNSKLEYKRKLRTAIRGITALARHPEILNPFRMGLFAYQVWSHKVLRWGVPWFMLFLFLTTLFLRNEGFIYIYALIVQTLFYLVAILGYLSPASRRNSIVRIVYYFSQTNLALSQALLMFLIGKRMTVWEPSKR